MIYTKDNIVGVKYKVSGYEDGLTYEISGLDILADKPTISWLENDTNRTTNRYSLKRCLEYLNTGEWKPISEPTTPRQQADDLLSEFVEWHKEKYYGLDDNPPQFEDIQDFLTHKFGE